MEVTFTTTSNIPWSVVIVAILVGIAMYIYFSFCLMKMAKRLGTPNGWFAFIPFLNYWLYCQMAGKPTSWFVIMLIFSFCFPIVTMVFVILILMDVAEKLGFENWWGVLTIIPIFNFYVFYKLAFTEPKAA